MTDRFERSRSRRDGHPLRDSHPVADLSLDDVFGLLAERRRRFALHALLDVDQGATDCETLTRTVATREARADEEEYALPELRDRVTRALHHVHLPKLDDAGVVDYDARSRTVRYWGHPVVEEYLLHVAPLEWGD